MNLKKTIPERAYRVKYGGSNFVIVDEIQIFEDHNNVSFVLQNNKFRDRLFNLQDHKQILSEKEGFYDWRESREMVLKLVFCGYRSFVNYIIFNAANSHNGRILTREEVLGDDINSDMYKCAHWNTTDLFHDEQIV